MKSKSVLIALAMVSVLALTACGGSKTQQMKTGADAMRTVISDTQKAVAAGDAAKAATEAKEIDEAWEKFEDQAKEKNKDLYGKIEEQLDVIQAATKASPIDAKLVSDASTKLNSLLDELLK